MERKSLATIAADVKVFRIQCYAGELLYLLKKTTMLFIEFNMEDNLKSPEQALIYTVSLQWNLYVSLQWGGKRLP